MNEEEAEKRVQELGEQILSYQETRRKKRPLPTKEQLFAFLISWKQFGMSEETQALLSTFRDKDPIRYDMVPLPEDIQNIYAEFIKLSGPLSRKLTLYEKTVSDEPYKPDPITALIYTFTPEEIKQLNVDLHSWDNS